MTGRPVALFARPRNPFQEAGSSCGSKANGSKPGAPSPGLSRAKSTELLCSRAMESEEKQESPADRLSGGPSAEHTPEREQKQETNGPLVPERGTG